MSASVIAVTNQKGGVGKTTTAINLAYCLSKSGKRVLLVDFDPQGNATSGLGVNKQTLEKTVLEVIRDGAGIGEAVIKTPHKNLYIVPATPHLANAEVELANADRRFSRLKLALSQADEYDFVVIDSPPSLSLLTVNGIAAGLRNTG
jgi:chromosome partitioning protein